jgi:organic hydroperoxide reductase OsmC/OhrA
MSIVKDYQYAVTARLEEEGVTRVTVPGKAVIHVTAPPEFRGGALGFWSPEELLVAAAASCYAITLEAIAERRELTLENIGVHGTGHVTKRDDGRFAFVAIELGVRLETDAADVAGAEKAAHDAERACLVGIALDVPVHVTVTVQAAAGVS